MNLETFRPQHVLAQARAHFKSLFANLKPR